MCARIFDWLTNYAEHNSDAHPACDKRPLQRALHGYRHRTEFVSALEFLTKNNAITIQSGTVTLIDASADERLRLPNPYDPTGQ
jgi:hypothetical protein